MDWTGVIVGVSGSVALVAGYLLTYAATSKGRQADSQNPVTVAQAYASLVNDLRKQNDDQTKRLERLESDMSGMRQALEEAKSAEIKCLSRMHYIQAEVTALRQQLTELGVPLFRDEGKT